MKLFEPLLIALSTYSAIPVPQFDWNEKNMRYAICFFPGGGDFLRRGALAVGGHCTGDGHERRSVRSSCSVFADPCHRRYPHGRLS